MDKKQLLLKFSIHYYCANNYFRTLTNLCNEAIRLYPNDLKFKFYSAISLSLNDQIQESNQRVYIIQENDELILGCLLILINNHKKSSPKNEEEISNLETKLRQIRKTANENCLYYAALYLFLVKKYDKCKEYANRILKMNPNQNKEIYILKGFLELNTSLNEINLNSALKYFEISSKLNNPECLIGKFYIFFKLKNYQKAEKIIDELILTYPSTVPFYLEKIKLNNQFNNWNQIFELSTKVLTIDQYCIESHLYLVLYYQIINYNKEQICSKLNDLIQSLELFEPNNASLFYKSSKLFSRLTITDDEILNFTIRIMEKALLLNPSNLEYKCEIGSQLFKINNLSESKKYFNNVIQEDEKNLDALYYILLIGLNRNDKDCLKKINSFEHIHDLKQLSIDLLYLCGLYNEHQKKNFSQIDKYLDLVISRHMDEIKATSIGIDFYIKLNIERIINIVKLYLKYAPIEPIIINKNEKNSVIISSKYLKKIENYLKPIISYCPSLNEPIYLMANIKYLLGDFDFALNLIEQFIKNSPLFNSGFLLKAKILILQNKPHKASKALEVALSYNFQIRENLDYLIAKAKILKLDDKIDEAIKLLNESKLNLLSKVKDTTFNENFIVLVELLIIEYNAILNKQEEARNLIQNLVKNYKNTIYENHILIVYANIEETFNKVDKAISILKKIKISNNIKDETKSWNSDLEYFIESKEYLANIYLKYFKDTKLCVKCYEDILNVDSSVESYIILGNFYLTILEPEKSIEIYEQALKKNPKNAQLIRRVGQLYIKIHFYEKAITYYKASIKSSGYNELRFDLAYLFYKLKRYEESIEIINNAKNDLKNLSKHFAKLEYDAKFNYLMSKIYLEKNNKELAITYLKSTYSSQMKVMRRLMTENHDLLNYHENFTFKICNELADQLNLNHQDHKQSIYILKEALNYNENNEEILLKLSQSELDVNNLEESHNYCRTILNNLPNHDGALLILIQIMFRKNEFENSLKFLQQILDNNPGNFFALMYLIEASRRTGNLTDLIPTYLDKTESFIKETNSIIEYNNKFAYCKALYLFYISSSDQALKLFILSKNDQNFGLYSLEKIIEICINPESEIIGSEAFNCNDLVSNNKLDAQETFFNLTKKFLKEINENYSDHINYLIIKSMVIFVQKNKNEIDKILNELMSEENKSLDNIKLNFAIATGQMVLNQVSKGKIILKKICKLDWNYLESEYFEKSWLLLADVYIQSNRYDSAIGLLKKCLNYNKSCIKAYKYLGVIKEKEQSYKDAMENYKKAWFLSNKENIKIGYRLAYCAMKCSYFIEAIDCCEILLHIEPSLTRIKNEILDKCKLNLF